MITGFNTNVRYRGVLFHVQTEDSGRAHPHLISHVYSGGTIIASHKSEYADRLSSDDLDREVRQLMEVQHKAMIARLEQGDLDNAITERLGGAAAVSGATTRPEAVAVEPTVEAIAEPEFDALATSATQPEGMDPQPARARAGARSGRAAAPRPAGPKRAPFSESDKPLDELVLEYLVEKARRPRGGG